MTTKWENKTIGTIKDGNKIKGKYKIAILGCSKANFCNGKGLDKIEFITMFIKRSKQT